MAVSDFSLGGVRFCGIGSGILVVHGFCKTARGVEFCGAGAIGASVVFDRWGAAMYAVYDYWHTSPNFFLARCGVMLVILGLAHLWYRWGWGAVGFSPVEQLGRTSLLVYWVHVEFVYGRFSILPKGKCGIAAATAGMCVIFLAMLGLSVARTRWSAQRELVG